MVRKVTIFVACFVLIAAIGGTAQAAEVYDGNMSTTYITYFRDILSDMDIGKDYVAFRSGQYSYTMVVGDLLYSNGRFTLDGTATQYTITNDSGFNASYSYDVTEISSFTLSVGDNMVYSDLGDFPQLINMGEQYGILQTATLWVLVLSMLIRNIFRNR